jgi:hypothetical protein
MGSITHAYDPSTGGRRKQRQVDLKFKDSLGYIARPCLKKQMNKKDKNHTPHGGICAAPQPIPALIQSLSSVPLPRPELD